MSNQLLHKYRVLTEGISELYTFQKEAITSLLNGQNTLCIAPTGKGKSIIYQLAAQELDGLTIVVSPLTALIKEQVNILREAGVNAIGITSDISFQDQRILLRNFSINPPKILFLSPERLQNSFFRAAILRSVLKVNMVVVDEAHCVSQWGIDFRPEYGQIEEFIEFITNNGLKPVTLALTATLGIKARNDIIEAYQISPSAVFIEKSFIRSELHLNFIEVDEEFEKEEKIYELLELAKIKKAIIYFYSVNRCRKIAEKLSQKGYTVGQYYSAMDSEEKEDVYEQYITGEITILCATTAFGMGMNIPDIDTIIHYHIPNSIEEYYQQVGRAARDKRLCSIANCYLLWSEKNFDYKIEEHIEPQQLSLERINESFKKFGLEGNANKIQAVEYSNYSAQNLSFFRYLLEKNGALRFIGEVNGTPKSIKFKEENLYWNTIVERMEFGNNFVRAAEKSQLSLQELINYIFDQELSGKIKTFKALEKKLFFVSDYDEVPIDIAYEIIEASMAIVEFKTTQLKALQKMIKSAQPEKEIYEYFN